MEHLETLLIRQKKLAHHFQKKKQSTTLPCILISESLFNSYCRIASSNSACEDITHGSPVFNRIKCGIKINFN